MKIPAGWFNPRFIFPLTLFLLFLFLFFPTPLDGLSWFPLHLAMSAIVVGSSVPASYNRKKKKEIPYFLPFQTALCAVAALAVKVLFDTIPLMPLLFFAGFPLSVYRNRFYKSWIPGASLGAVALGRWVFSGNWDLLPWTAIFLIFSIYLAWMLSRQEISYKDLKKKHERMISDASRVSSRASHVDFGPEDLPKRREMATSAVIEEDDLLQMFLQVGSRLMSARTGLLLVPDVSGGYKIRAAVSKGYADSLNEDIISGDKGILYLALQRSGFLCVSDWTRSEDSSESIPFYTESVKIRSFILKAVYEEINRGGQQMPGEGNVKCILYFDSPEPETFKDEDWLRKQVSDVAESISRAMDRSSKIHAMSNALAVKTTVEEYAKSLTEDLDISKIIERAKEAIESIIKDPGGIAVLIGGKGELAVYTTGTMLKDLEGQVIKEREASHIGLLSRNERNTNLMYLEKQRKGTPYFLENEKLGKTASFVAVKATTKDDRGGRLKVILAVLSRNENAFDNDTKSDLHMIADITAPVLVNALLHHRVREISRRDGLTGLLNHRVFHKVLESKMKETDRGYIKGLAVLMVDVDNFKVINDTYGHPVGDEVLGELADRLSGGIRELDTVARYGGEEFAVVLHNLPRKQAAKIAEKLRRSISNKAFKTDAGDLDLTVSIGYALFREGDDITLQKLVGRADKALYEAKRSGRNRVVGDIEIMGNDDL